MSRDNSAALATSKRRCEPATCRKIALSDIRAIRRERTLQNAARFGTRYFQLLLARFVGSCVGSGFQVAPEISIGDAKLAQLIFRRVQPIFPFGHRNEEWIRLIDLHSFTASHLVNARRYVAVAWNAPVFASSNSRESFVEQFSNALDNLSNDFSAFRNVSPSRITCEINAHNPSSRSLRLRRRHLNTRVRMSSINERSASTTYCSLARMSPRSTVCVRVTLTRSRARFFDSSSADTRRAKSLRSRSSSNCRVRAKNVSCCSRVERGARIPIAASLVTQSHSQPQR